MNGLMLACAVAVLNSLTDVSRKKVLDRGSDASLVIIWCKLVALACYLIAIALLTAWRLSPQLPPIGAELGLSPFAAFGLFLLLNVLLEGSAIALHYRALQVSPLSLCMPFMALTPVFLLPAGALFLHESISAGMIVGVLLVTAGSLAINRHLFAEGWWGPARGIIRERGSRYMMFSALLLAGSTVLDKWFVSSGGEADLAVRVSRAFTLAIGKGSTLLLFFFGLLAVRRRSQARIEDSAAKPAPSVRFEWGRVWRIVPGWVLAAGSFEALLLTSQLIAIQFAPAALVISIKRSSILLGCVFGWLFFQERGIADRLIGSAVMVAGVTIFFLTKPDDFGHVALEGRGAGLLALLTIGAMLVALRLTRDWSRKSSPGNAA